MGHHVASPWLAPAVLLGMCLAATLAPRAAAFCMDTEAEYGFGAGTVNRTLQAPLLDQV